MCDSHTTDADDAALARLGLNRRDFALASGAALLALNAPAAAATGKALTEQTVQLRTADGMADAFFVHPRKGRHPGVILWPDIAGLREAYRAMARQLAGAGYAVLVINHYYRSSPAPVLDSIMAWRTPEGQARLKPMIAALSPEGTARDARACVAFLDTQRAVDRQRRIGTHGYCMGGPFAVRSAAAMPARIGAAAAFHGSGMVSDGPASPHRLLGASRADFLFAIARNDDQRTPGDKDALREAAQAAGRPAEIEVYPADHGWCTLDSPVYDREQARRAAERLLALYARL